VTRLTAHRDSHGPERGSLASARRTVSLGLQDVERTRGVPLRTYCVGGVVAHPGAILASLLTVASFVSLHDVRSRRGRRPTHVRAHTNVLFVDALNAGGNGQYGDGVAIPPVAALGAVSCQGHTHQYGQPTP
jgi:hypothetical protein